MTHFRAGVLCLALALLAIPLAAQTEHFVTANPDFTFTPSFLEIEVGDTVTWSNAGGFHNVNAPGFFRCADGCDGEGGNGDPNVSAWSFSQTFDSDATIDYFCEPHLALGMEGTVIVGSGASQAILDVLGACPGVITITITGLTPNTPTGLLFSAAEGDSQLVGGPCAGAQTGLDNPNLLTVVNSDANGEVSLSPNAPANACGFFLQAIDGATCVASTVGQVPN